MKSRRDTLAARVARAQQEMSNWNPSQLSTMQLQGTGEAFRTIKGDFVEPLDAPQRSDNHGFIPSRRNTRPHGSNQ